MAGEVGARRAAAVAGAADADAAAASSRAAQGGRGGRRLQMLERTAAAPRPSPPAHAAGAPAQCEAERKLAFEGCPFYIGERHAAAEIRAALPELKLLAVLRGQESARSPPSTTTCVWDGSSSAATRRR